MQAYDVFMLTILVAAIAWGAWKGLAWQIASIASIGLSYFVSVNFRNQVAQFFHYDPPQWNSFLAMLVLYLGTSLVIWLAFNLLREVLERLQLKEFDRQIGGLLGAAKGVLICTVVTLFTMGLGTDSQRQAAVSSRSGYYIAMLLQNVEPMLPAEYRPQLDQTIAQLEQRRGLAQGTYLQGLQLPFSWNPNQANGWNGNQTSGWNAQPSSDLSAGWNQNPNQDPNSLGSWVTPQNVDRLQRDVLPRIEQEGARLQQELDRFVPPRTSR